MRNGKIAMYTIKFTGEFKRQMKLCERRGYDMEQLRTAILTLSTEGKLPAEYLPHMLHGDHKGQCECHILFAPRPYRLRLE